MSNGWRGERGGRGRGASKVRGGSNSRGGFGGNRSQSDDEKKTPARHDGQQQRGRGATGRGRGNGRGSFNGARSNGSSGSPSTPRPSSTAHMGTNYQQRLDKLARERPGLKNELIAMKLMNPDGQMQLKDAIDVRGLCEEMCPEYERLQRITRNDMKPPEFTSESLRLNDRSLRVPDESRMVKAYTRSSAGEDIELPTDKRTPLACQKSMNYMLDRLDKEGLGFLYAWLWDRTRAVRKDLTSQHLSTTEDFNLYIECMERCVRFHLMTLHKMATVQTGDYSREQDIKQLMASLKSLEDRYDINRKDGILSTNQAEFIAYDILISLYNQDNMEEYNLHQFPDHVQKNSRFQTAYEIYKAAKAIVKHKRVTMAVAQQNWKKFWKILASHAVPYIMACAAEMSFGKIRYTILDAIWRSYRRPGPGGQVAPNTDWTAPKLLEVLGFDDPAQLKDFCKTYGFLFNSNGNGEYLNFQSPGIKVHGKGLQDLWEPYAQPDFSRRIVEAKLFQRNMSALVKGMSVQEARSRGLITEGDAELTFNSTEPEQELDEHSLFVPEDSKANQSIPPSFNPFAQPFKPNGSLDGSFKAPSSVSTPILGPTDASPAGNPNPFKVIASIAPNGPTPTPTFFTTPSSKPSILNTPSITPGTPASLTTSAPFTTSPATGQTVQPGLFDPAQGAIKFSPAPTSKNPFSSLSSTPQAPSTAAPLFSNPAAQPPKQSAISSPFPTLSENAFKSAAPSPSAPATSSSTLFQDINTPSPIAPAVTFHGVSSQQSFHIAVPGPSGPSLEEQERRRVEEEQQRERARLQHEQEQRLREENRLREEQARLREEARLREVQARAAAAAAEQQRQQEEARQRQRERDALAQLQAKEQQRLQEERSAAYGTLAETLLWKTDHSLLEQFIVNEIEKQALKTFKILELEEIERKIEYIRERRRERLSVKYFFLWRQRIYSRKLNAHARRRRKWLRANAAKLEASEAQAGTMSLARAKATPTPQSNGASEKQQVPTTNGDFKKPSAPASAQSSKAPANTAKQPNVPRRTPSLSHSNSSLTSSSQATTYEMKMAAVKSFKNPRAPIDRTETDWFVWRAIGLDPSKYSKAAQEMDFNTSKQRKRSLNFDSSDDEVAEVESKRSRTSITPVPRLGVSPTASVDDLIARVQAIKASVNTGRSPRSSSIGFTPTASTARAAATYDVINRARAQLRKLSPATQVVQHDFGRSVPDLASPYSAARSNKSTATPPLHEPPAFWGRSSRFVPRHLYGQGPEAIRAYFREQRGENDSSQELLQLSSPVTTQQSYYATQHDANMDADAEYDSAEGEEGYDSGDQDLQYGSVVGETQYADEEYYSEEGDEDGEDGYEAGLFAQDGLLDGNYYDEEFEGVSDFEQCAQRTSPGPGATQDDAIELSD